MEDLSSNKLCLGNGQTTDGVALEILAPFSHDMKKVKNNWFRGTTDIVNVLLYIDFLLEWFVIQHDCFEQYKMNSDMVIAHKVGC